MLLQAASLQPHELDTSHASRSLHASSKDIAHTAMQVGLCLKLLRSVET